MSNSWLSLFILDTKRHYIQYTILSSAFLFIHTIACPMEFYHCTGTAYVIVMCVFSKMCCFWTWDDWIYFHNPIFSTSLSVHLLYLVYGVVCFWCVFELCCILLGRVVCFNAATTATTSLETAYQSIYPLYWIQLEANPMGSLCAWFHSHFKYIKSMFSEWRLLRRNTLMCTCALCYYIFVSFGRTKYIPNVPE